MDDQKQRDRDAREARTADRAKQIGKAITYIDDDGCEVTVTPGGHVFYNASDWW